VTSPLPVSTVAEDVAVIRPASVLGHDLILCGTVALLLFGPLAFGATETWSQFLLEAGSAWLFVLWAVQQFRSGTWQIRGNPLFAPMLAFGALVVLQFALRQTASTERTLSAALLFTAYALLCFLLVQTLRQTRQMEWIGRTVSIYGVSVALFALLQGFSSNGNLYWLRKPYFGGWIYGPYVNHNHYAGLMEMLTPVPLVIALSRRCSVQKRWLAGVAASIMATSILFSGSRGGMIAFATEMLLLAVLLLRRNARSKTMGAMVAFVLLTLALAAWMGDSELIQRLGSIHTQARSELSGGTRLSVDRDALRMFAQKPLLGWGLGLFPDIYPQFRSFYTNFWVDHAHNDYLELLVETGTAGFLIAVWFLLTTFRSAARKLRQREWGTIGLARLAALVGVSGILVHSLVDFNLQIPANAAIFYVLCTLATMKLESATASHRIDSGS
jgi:O-antigen ligase